MFVRYGNDIDNEAPSISPPTHDFYQLPLYLYDHNYTKCSRGSPKVPHFLFKYFYSVLLTCILQDTSDERADIEFGNTDGRKRKVVHSTSACKTFPPSQLLHHLPSDTVATPCRIRRWPCPSSRYVLVFPIPRVSSSIHN